MPLYEYECESCGEIFETIQKFSDEPLQTHTNCGGKLHRLLSAPALQFKGTGWYVTDYGRKNGSSPASSGTKPDTHAGTAAKASDTAAKPAPASDKK